MSWLSHFSGWVGEKKNTLLPIVTGLAGFAAGMIPGIGGVAQKFVDKLGNKITGGAEILDQVNGVVGGNSNPAAPGGGQVPAADPTSKTSAQMWEEFRLSNADPMAPAAGYAGAGSAPAGPNWLLIGGGILAALMLSK